MSLAILGVDVGKVDFHCALAVDAAVVAKSFPNSPIDFSQLCRWLRNRNVERVQACLESTCLGYLHKIGKVWYTTVDLPRLPGAKLRQKEIKLGSLSKSDAQAKEREVLREIEKQPTFEVPNVTVEQLLHSWLSHMAPTATSQPISPKTHERYASIVRNQLIPNLGTFPIAKLNPRIITEMQTKLRQQGLSGTTCLHVHRVLHTALNFGVKTLRIVKTNAASEVRPPKGCIRKLDVDEKGIIMLLDATKGTRLEMPVVLAAMTGVQRGELLAPMAGRRLRAQASCDF